MSGAVDSGTRTFTQIYIDRPWTCRWSVLRPVALQDSYVLVDMYDTRSIVEGLKRTFFIGEHHLFPTSDAAVMAACLNHKE